MERAQYERMFRLESANWWFRLKRDFVYSLLRRYAPNRRPLRLADLGCGTGIVLEECPLETRRLGFEHEARALAFARSRGLGGLTRASCTSLPVADATLDAALLLDVLEHIERDDVALAELGRVLRPDGCGIITVPAHPFLWSPHDEVLHHQRRYTWDSLVGRIRAAGLEIRLLTYGFATPFPLACAVRAGGRLLSRRHGREPSDDFFDIPGWMNELFYRLSRWEVPLVRSGRLPFGISLLSVVGPRAPGT